MIQCLLTLLARKEDLVMCDILLQGLLKYMEIIHI
jgi:hypothetical protein